MKYAIVIPARYKSSRFEGKPLAKIKGKPMIAYVYDVCIKVLAKENVYVATDDDRIKEFCESYGMRVVMTSRECLTGTDRVYEASKQIDADVIINVQGDEPLILENDIKKIIEASKTSPKKIINGMCDIDDENDFRSLTVPKVVCNLDNELLYMSRASIPTNKKGEFVSAKKQVCIYAFPKNNLKDFYEYGKKTDLEKIEDIEILRFLELGYKIQMVSVSQSSIAVDTPEDLEKVEQILLKTEEKFI
ncbi:MAG: 3-deoxy-manno-octulosonate cytidylyltransferase [Elusimicrobiaceae bacterium]|jgi:3-deoxy-manno-octulosonate cytidylyltransferase (CMP-KDO synthetase)|nr:3-deoxy-manno-octulosonate cytidylyltransferase [Elusimicrobiaceae bacterium]MBT3954935.1 3-deoxy-manno-octulosonate cytidylyltransferase [Elusimicrobiaceae bacterium]MBT4008585.1 3-deoxy-manno-octulosonate cytidylyltransferase [Elusimicrobiaceae bacterium]MBT4402977.1 3-deoxy-manno-octulosonate cytidylyltransferase [Elusimicrobiaceae bacterium]MBT4439751.1 3-deoxy-manno-octulosonate cytidylyltransferase [Elusimicrobiaceae bacterium]